MTTVTEPVTRQLTLSDHLRKITSSYLLRRLVRAVLTVWLVATITFFVIRAMPGNAIDVLMQIDDSVLPAPALGASARGGDIFLRV